MKTHPIQTTFTVGELTPRLHSRTDADFYPMSVAECRNFVVTPQGSLSKRQGTEYITDADDRNTVTRIETFRRAVGEDYIVEFGDNFVRLVNRSGPLTNARNILRNADFSAGNAEWTIQQVRPGKPPAPHPETWPPYLSGVGTMEFTVFHPNPGPLDLEPRVNLYSQFVTLQNPTQDCVFTSNIRIPTGDGITDDISFDYRFRAGITMGGTDFADVTIPVVVPPDASGVIEVPINITFNTSGVPVMWIQFGADLNSTTDEAIFYMVNSPLLLVNSDDTDPIEFDSPWTAEQVPDIQIAMATGVSMMVFAHENMPPYMLVEQDFIAGEFVFQEMPLVQPAQPYWEDNNWPACPCFHEGRLWFGRSFEDPSGLWGSESGNYFDFDASGPTEDSDPVFFPLASNGRISWLWESKNLIIMTDVGAYLGESTGGVITASDFSFDLQFAFGGAPIQPTASGRDTVFISNDQGKVRTMYDGGDETNGDVAVDISLVANHLFLNRADDVEYCQDPNLQLNILTQGRLASALFSNEEKLLGWYQQRLAPGLTIEAICRTFDLLGTSLWCVVHHNTGVKTIEVMNGTEYLHYLLDSFVLRLIPDNRIIDGLERFEGRTVSLVEIGIDPTGAFGRQRLSNVPDVAAIGEAEVENGQITVPDGLDGQVAIGLPYDAHVKLHKAEFGSTTGSAQPTRQRYSYVMARIYESHAPNIMDQRAEILDYMDHQQVVTTTDHITGDVFADVSGWDGTDSRITISQDLPLNTHISGVFGILATNSK